MINIISIPKFPFTKYYANSIMSSMNNLGTICVSIRTSFKKAIYEFIVGVTYLVSY